MSQENVELSRRVYSAIGRRALEAILALYAPDVEGEPSGGVVFGTSFQDRAGARRFWNELFTAFPDFSGEILEIRDLGDLVIGAVRVWGHGAGSDAPVEETIWLVAEWRDKKCVWWRSCASESEALEVVRLRG